LQNSKANSFFGRIFFLISNFKNDKNEFHKKYEMSLLWKISSSDRLLIKSGFLSISAYYSRRSKSEEFESFYKVVSAKPNIRDQVDLHFQEGGPNWEIFNPRGNRFYLPNSLGPGWQNSNSTVTLDVILENLIDFDSTESDKLHFSSKRCPTLIRNNLQELFPVAEVSKKSNELTVITLSYQKHTEVEYGAKNFVIAAREICKRLHHEGHWADFMNPFSGKPFYYHFTDQKLYKIDKRFRGFGIKYEDRNNCLVITSDVDATFSGSIFTDATHDQDQLKSMIRFHKELCDEFESDDENDR